MRSKDLGISFPTKEDNIPDWTLEQLEQYIYHNDGRCLVLLDGYIVDVTSYLVEHVCPSQYSGILALTVWHTTAWRFKNHS
jgi:hypothetical protein